MLHIDGSGIGVFGAQLLGDIYANVIGAPFVWD